MALSVLAVHGVGHPAYRHDVDSAFQQALTGSWTDRARDRLRGETSSPADLAPLAERAAETAAGLARPAQDAAVALAGGKPSWPLSTPGQQVDPAAVVDALEARPAGRTPREVPLQVVAPEGKCMPARIGPAGATVVIVRGGPPRLPAPKAAPGDTAVAAAADGG